MLLQAGAARRGVAPRARAAPSPPRAAAAALSAPPVRTRTCVVPATRLAARAPGHAALPQHVLHAP
jgi:hypothetical protein